MQKQGRYNASAGEGRIISPIRRYVVAAGLRIGDPMKQFNDTVRTRSCLICPNVTGSADGHCQTFTSGR